MFQLSKVRTDYPASASRLPWPRLHFDAFTSINWQLGMGVVRASREIFAKAVHSHLPLHVATLDAFRRLTMAS